MRIFEGDSNAPQTSATAAAFINTDCCKVGYVYRDNPGVCSPRRGSECGRHRLGQYKPLVTTLIIFRLRI